MSDATVQLQQRLGYEFRDPTLLACALTHASYLPEHPDVPESNQRLEFLGDSVLQLVLTEELFQLFPDAREGLLSQRRAALAKGVFLAQLAREISLDAALLLGTSEEFTGGRQRPAALEDAMEALIGAIYLDSDLPTIRDILLKLYGPLADRLAGTQESENPKGRLQELVQPKHGNNALRYAVTRTDGKDHARAYEVEVFLEERSLGRGSGTSKKLAEEAAAHEALASLKLKT